MVQGHGKNCVGGAEIGVGTQWLREGGEQKLLPREGQGAELRE